MMTQPGSTQGHSGASNANTSVLANASHKQFDPEVVSHDNDNFHHQQSSPSDNLPDLSQSSSVHDMVDIMDNVCKQFWGCRTALTAFARASLASGNTCTVEKGNYPLWPCPPPHRWRRTASNHMSPIRRRRGKYHRVMQELTQLIVISLNFETLGGIVCPPDRARVGAHITSAQHSILERIERMVAHFLHVGSFEASDLGRVREKFDVLIGSVQELPVVKDGFEDLTELLMHVHQGLNPYDSHFNQRPHNHKEADLGQGCDIELGQTLTKTLSLGSKPIVANRVKWKNPPSFAAEEFLDPLVKAAYLEPEVLRKPPDSWAPAVPAKVHCSKSELLQLIELWDSLGACCLMDSRDKDMDEAVGLFCVPKDDEYDRLIINPKTINSRMFSVSSSTKELAPGSMLSLLSLPEGYAYRFSADDLTDFYYTFRVSTARASRNAVRLKFDSHELSHLGCYRKEFEGKTILVCLKTLAMGDNLAVEIAQQAHSNVLKQLCGAMLPHESLRYRRPIPRSPFIELLAIDDHVGIQLVSMEELEHNIPKRDTVVFTAASKAYKSVGLIQHPQKQKRNRTSGTILGADFDGLNGRVMAPRCRVAILCSISISVARRGSCTRSFLSILMGCWIHVLLFRRPLFSIVDQLFKEGRDLEKHVVFRLSRKAINELQLLACLGLTAQSDLRVGYSSKLYCTDASPEGASVIAADVGVEASKEIWRHTEQRGYYTRLQSPVAEILQEKGFDVCSDELFQSSSPLPDTCSRSIPSSLNEGVLFDCVEVFRGHGNWSCAHASLGLVTHDGFDIQGARLRFTDLAEKSVCAELLSLALRRVVREWHFGVPCISFGTLRRPQVRSLKYPAGFDPHDPFTAYHNMLAIRSAFIMTVALLLGQFVSAEQPRNSRMFMLHCFRILVTLGCVISHYDFCAFGSAFHKPSKWLHNKPWLIPIERRCDCPYRGKHFVVQGSFTKESVDEFCSRCRPSCENVYGDSPKPGDRASTFSGRYPSGLIDRMASGSLASKQGCPLNIPLEIRIRSLQELSLPSDQITPQRCTEESYPARPWYEDPEWIGELSDSLPFHELFRYRFRRAGHINVNESRTFKSLIKSAAKTEPDTRFAALLDSRVTIGAAAKGRSSSEAISRILRGSISYIIGGGLYPGMLHTGSSFNRADGPSRGRPIQPPTKELPGWFTELQQGRPAAFDAVIESSRVPKIASRWLRFLLLLAGDIEPHPGPVPPVRTPRGPLDMTIGFSKVTSGRMSSCLSSFKHWVETEAQIEWDVLASDPEGLSWALRGYGMFCFETGLPRYWFVYAITAVQDQYPAARRYTGVAWQVDKKWQIFEPGRCRAVLPAVVIRAALCLSCLWKWRAWCGIVLLGFSAMLHPAEMVFLCREDLIFPADVNYDCDSLYVRIKDPKTARFARRQHGRIDDLPAVEILFGLFGSLNPKEKLFTGSASTFRKQWNSIMSALGVPCKQELQGATPGSLRGSGATFMFSAVQDLSLVAWRGRWSQVKTLEYYLQEVSAFMLIHQLDAISRTKIFYLSDCSMVVLRSSAFTNLAEQDDGGGKQQQTGNVHQPNSVSFEEFEKSFRDTDHGQIGRCGPTRPKTKKGLVCRDRSGNLHECR